MKRFLLFLLLLPSVVFAQRPTPTVIGGATASGVGAALKTDSLGNVYITTAAAVVGQRPTPVIVGGATSTGVAAALLTDTDGTLHVTCTGCGAGDIGGSGTAGQIPVFDGNTSITSGTGLTSSATDRVDITTAASGANSYGININAATGSGTNVYGLKIASQTAGTNNWNIWSGPTSFSVASPWGTGASNVFTGANYLGLAAIAEDGAGPTALIGQSLLTGSGSNALASGVGAEVLTYGTVSANFIGGNYSYFELHGTGNVSTLAMFDAVPSINPGGAAVTNLVQFYARETSVAATNKYGLLVENVNSGTSTNYSIYTKAGLVRFGDQVYFAGTSAGAPTTPPATTYTIYVDTSDSNKLKAKGPSGTVTTLATQ